MVAPLRTSTVSAWINIFDGFPGPCRWVRTSPPPDRDREDDLILILGTSPGNGRPAKVRIPEKPLKNGRRPMDIDTIGDLNIDLAAVGGSKRPVLNEKAGEDIRLVDHEPPTAYEHLPAVDDAVSPDANTTEPRKGIRAEASTVKSGLARRSDAHKVDAASGREQEAASGLRAPRPRSGVPQRVIRFFRPVPAVS